MRRSTGSSSAGSSTSRAPTACATQAAGEPGAAGGPRSGRASMRVRTPCARSPMPSSEQRAPRGRLARHRQPGAPRPPGHRARARAGRRDASTIATSATRSTTPSPAWPIRSSRADRGPSGADPICANDTCRWIFYDTSRTGRRRWCDMATCGNRAKAARHRARAKAAAGNAADDAAARRRGAVRRRRVAARQLRRARGSAGPPSRGGSSTPRRTATGSRR